MPHYIEALNINKHEAAFAALREKATPEEQAVLDDVLRVCGELTADVTELRLHVADALQALRPFAEYADAPADKPADFPARKEYERASKSAKILAATPKAQETLATMILAVSVAELTERVHSLSVMMETRRIYDPEMVRRLQVEQNQLQAAVIAWVNHKRRLGAKGGKGLVL